MEDNKPPWLEEAVAFIQKFRPYATKEVGRTWHDQIKSILYVTGTMLSMIAIPEYPVPSPKPRGGRGRIDLVWTFDSTPVAAFEIEGGIAPGSIRKLESFDAPYKFVISAGESGHKMKLLGSPRLAGTDIEHLVIEPTTDPGACTASVFEIIDGLIECEVGFEGVFVETKLSHFTKNSPEATTEKTIMVCECGHSKGGHVKGHCMATGCECLWFRASHSVVAER